MCTFCYLSYISTMPLPQTNCNKFFFSSYFVMSLPQVFFPPQFWQWHCHKPTGINFFPTYFGNVIATTPFHFILSQKNVTNQTVSVKKNTEKIRICVFFFYISPLFRQCHCHKQQIFFSILFKFIPTFFPLNFSNDITTNYVRFFVFVFVHNTLE